MLQNAFGDVANDKTISDLYNLMSYYFDRMEFGLNTDRRKVLNVNLLDAAGTQGNLSTVGTVTTVTGVTTVSTVSSVTDQTNIGGLQAKRMVEAQLDMAFNTGFLSNITFA